MPQNPLFRMLAWNWLAGAAAAVTLLVGILATNAMHLRALILASDNPGVPIAMLLFGFLVTFCSVAMGSAIMALGQDSDGPNGGHRAAAEALREAKQRGRAAQHHYKNGDGNPGAHPSFVEDFTAKQRLEKRKTAVMVCLYDFALHDFA